MEAEQIKTLTDGTARYSLSVVLDGADFRLFFEWNTRDQHWYLSIRDAENESITGCESIRLVRDGWPLRRIRDVRRPIGELFVLSETVGDPGLKNLGTDVSLIYVPKALIDLWDSEDETVDLIEYEELPPIGPV